MNGLSQITFDILYGDYECDDESENHDGDAQCDGDGDGSA